MRAEFGKPLRVYDAEVSRRLPGREAFFADSRGVAYSNVWLDRMFRAIRDEAGFTSSGNRPPRLYDLRH